MVHGTSTATIGHKFMSRSNGVAFEVDGDIGTIEVENLVDDDLSAVAETNRISRSGREATLDVDGAFNL